MPTGRAITIAAVVAGVLLLPVVVILVLGVYGSSITGDFPSDRRDGPSVFVEPESAAPGEPITIRGTSWEPRTLARVDLVMQSRRPEIARNGAIVNVDTPLPAVYVGEAVISRAGTFAIETYLPSTLPLVGVPDVTFHATATFREGEAAGEASVVFPLKPGPAAIATVVRDPNGSTAGGALVEMRTTQHQLLAAAQAADDGTVIFSGLAEGSAYVVSARQAGFTASEPLRITAVVEPTQVELSLAVGAQAVLYAAGTPLAPNSTQPTLAAVDLAAFVPLDQPAVREPAPAWALAADPRRGVVYLADEVATEVRVVNAVSGESQPSIQIAFPLTISTVDSSGEPVANADVGVYWLVRGERILVRGDTTDAEGRLTFDGMVAGASFEVTASASGLAVPFDQRPTVTISPNASTTLELSLAARSSQIVPPPSAATMLRGSTRVPLTGLVVSDIVVDPASGLLYVAGSDLTRGHLMVIDPDTRSIVHDWPILSGAGDIVPLGDGRTVAVTNRPRATVSRMSIETGEIESEIELAAWPEAIAYDGNGAIFVASLRDGNIIKIDATSMVALASRELDPGVNRMAMDPGGEVLLVSNLWHDTVTALRTEDLTVQFLLPVAKSPRAIAIDASGSTLIVASADRGTVTFYDLDTFDLRQTLMLDIPVNDIAAVPLPA